MESDAKTEVSKTALLRGVMKDVATLRADMASSLQAIESISTWAKTTVKPGMQQLQDTITSEIAGVKELNAGTDAYARGISAWIKDQLGTKLEILDQKIAFGIETRQKASEASLWAIFSAKLDEAQIQFDAYRHAMDQKHKELEETVSKMRDELKKSNALRAKAEQSVKHIEETFARLTRERAEEEANLFRKLTLKLEDERRAIEDERRKMADERKKYKHLLERHKLETEKSVVALASAPLAAPSNLMPSTALAYEAVGLVPVKKPAPIHSATESSKPTYSSVAQWLNSVGFEEYVSVFSAFGYESLHLVQLLDDGDLDVMSITKPGHRKALISAAAELANAIIVREPSNESISTSSLANIDSSSQSGSKLPASGKVPLPSNPNSKRPLPKVTDRKSVV